jgi:hypothetical protein
MLYNDHCQIQQLEAQLCLELGFTLVDIQFRRSRFGLNSLNLHQHWWSHLGHDLLGLWLEVE